MFNWKPGIVVYRDIGIGSGPVSIQEYVLVLDVKPSYFGTFRITGIFDSGIKGSLTVAIDHMDGWNLVDYE